MLLLGNMHRHFLASLFCATILTPPLFAEAPPVQGEPTVRVLRGQIFVAEVVGEGAYVAKGQRHSTRQLASFVADGALIETAPKSSHALVYSNGVGVFLDESTRLEIARLEQEPFPSELAEGHPVGLIHSRSDGFVPHGLIGVCTGELAPSSRMLFKTPHARVSIATARAAIRVTEDATTIYLLDGSTSVASVERDDFDTFLRAGEKAVIQKGKGAGAVEVSPIERAEIQSIEERVVVACRSRSAVIFGPAPRDGEELDLRPFPVTPTRAPANIVVSPDRLR